MQSTHRRMRNAHGEVYAATEKPTSQPAAAPEPGVEAIPTGSSDFRAMMPRNPLRSNRWLLAAAVASSSAFSFADVTTGPAANPAAVEELPQVVVIGTTPLEGLGLPANEVPANVQTATSKDIERQQSLTVTDYLNNNFTGVNVSESAANPFKVDINYHGFTA
jgi:outer membrane receptor protein involved in Fe transport